VLLGEDEHTYGANGDDTCGDEGFTGVHGVSPFVTETVGANCAKVMK
jgi:hypothetical protein